MDKPKEKPCRFCEGTGKGLVRRGFCGLMEGKCGYCKGTGKRKVYRRKEMKKVNLELVKKGKGFVLRNKETGEIREAWPTQPLVGAVKKAIVKTESRFSDSEMSLMVKLMMYQQQLFAAKILLEDTKRYVPMEVKKKIRRYIKNVGKINDFPLEVKPLTK